MEAAFGPGRHLRPMAPLTAAGLSLQPAFPYSSGFSNRKARRRSLAPRHG